MSLRFVLYLMTEAQPVSDILFKQEQDDDKSNLRLVVLDTCLLYKVFFFNFADGKCYDITTNRRVNLLGWCWLEDIPDRELVVLEGL